MSVAILLDRTVGSRRPANVRNGSKTDLAGKVRNGWKADIKRRPTRLARVSNASHWASSIVRIERNGMAESAGRLSRVLTGDRPPGQ